MKKLLCMVVIFTVLFAGCSSSPQSVSSTTSITSMPVPDTAVSTADRSVSMSQPESSQAGHTTPNVTDIHLVGNWSNPSCADGAFRGFAFSDTNEASFAIGVWEAGYDVYYGTYTVDGDVIKISMERPVDGYGEDITANYTIENDVLVLSDVQETPYVKNIKLLAGMGEFVFDKSEEPIVPL